MYLALKRLDMPGWWDTQEGLHPLTDGKEGMEGGIVGGGLEGGAMIGM